MNTISSLEYRYIERTDELEYIGRLLFYTDPYIYPAFFGSIENAEKIIPEAIRRELYCFSKENIYCAFYGKKPLAMICKNPYGEYKWNFQEWEELFQKNNLKLPDTFANVAKNYFQQMNAESFQSNIYVLAVCVLPEYRYQGIGKGLLLRFLEKHPKDIIVLDTLEDNAAGLALYYRAGFEKMEYYRGYNICEPYPCCVRMRKVGKL